MIALERNALERKIGKRIPMGFHVNTVIVVATMVGVTGCKVGNPLDRTVRVTQQPAMDDGDFPSPKTRLATGARNRASESSMAEAAMDDDSIHSPHDSTMARKAANPTSPKASLASGSTDSSAKSSRSSSLKKNTNTSDSLTQVSAAKVPDEYADLLDAFKDSPPEVQQQAIRQLIALSGKNAARTQSPEGIADTLKASMKNLPVLPDDSPDATTLPSRLASNQPLQPIDQREPIVSTSLPTSEDNSHDIGQVAQAGGEMAATHLEQPIQQTTHESDSDHLKPIADAAPAINEISDSELYQELVRRLATGSPGESDADRYRRLIISRHLTLFSGDPDGAVATIDGMTPDQQEFVRHHLLGMWSMIDTSGHPVAVRRWSAALPELRLATQRLSAVAESLEVKSLAFCKEIQSFGQVTKFETNRFEPGQKVILYCEIDNFVAKSTQDGFETALQGSYEIFDEKGQKVAGQVLPADEQVCANYLRDYFIAYQMGLPTGLEPGDYRLELTMECLNGQKYGQASIPVTITASATPR